MPAGVDADSDWAQHPIVPWSDAFLTNFFTYFSPR